jgi:hypothetical protein
VVKHRIYTPSTGNHTIMRTPFPESCGPRFLDDVEASPGRGGLAGVHDAHSKLFVSCTTPAASLA